MQPETTLITRETYWLQTQSQFDKHFMLRSKSGLRRQHCRQGLQRLQPGTNGVERLSAGNTTRKLLCNNQQSGLQLGRNAFYRERLQLDSFLIHQARFRAAFCNACSKSSLPKLVQPRNAIIYMLGKLQHGNHLHVDLPMWQLGGLLNPQAVSRQAHSDSPCLAPLGNYAVRV